MIAAAGVHSSLLPPVPINGNLRRHPLFSLLPPPSTTHLARKNPTLTLENGSGPISFSFSCSASRKWKGRTKGGDPLALEDEEDKEEEEEGADSEEDMLAFDKMRAWLRNKPVGFGEGKSYDVSLEEQLANEIEQSRKAQILNVSSLKNNQNQQQKQSKENEVSPDAICVRIGNLPRKKNIHRDLQLAFAEFRGILKISPAVLGNQKTRDPVCKGFAFLEFQSEEAAERFVRTYSNQSLAFGKVEKSITCHLSNPSVPPATSRKLSSDDEVVSVASETDTSYLAPSEDNQGLDERRNLEEGKQRLGKLFLSSQPIDTKAYSGSSSEESSEKSGKKLASHHSTHSQEKASDNSSKPKRTKAAKPKQQRKDLTRTLPGSALRLRVRERTALSGVFSKYGSNVVAGSVKEN